MGVVGHDDDVNVADDDESQKLFRIRLNKIKRNIEKLSDDALQSAKLTDPSHDTKQTSNNNNNDNKNINSNDDVVDAVFINDREASYRLGMELFGQVSVVEKNLQDSLFDLETEVQDLLNMSAAGTSCGEGLNSGDGNYRSDINTMDLQMLESQRDKLKIKIEFLKECSSARALLDESIALSSPSTSSSSVEEDEEQDLVKSAKKCLQALEMLSKVKQQIKQSEQNQDEKYSAYRIISSIQTSLRCQKVDILSHAKNLWYECVEFGPNHMTVRSSSSSSLGIETAYNVLQVFADDGNSATEDIIRNFTRTLHGNVFQPILNDHKKGRSKTEWTFHEESTEKRSGRSTSSDRGSSGKCTFRKLEWTHKKDEKDIFGASAGKEKPDASESSNLEAWKDSISFIERIVVFVSSNVLLNKGTLCKMVGERLFGKPKAPPEDSTLDALGLESCRIGDDDGVLLEPLMEAMEETCVPKYVDPNQVSRLEEMGNELRSFIDPFVQELLQANILPSEGETRISRFASTFQRQYVDNRRRIILNEARDLLMNNDYHNTVQVGVDVDANSKANGKDDVTFIPNNDDGLAVFKLQKSCVSDTAFKLIALCRKAMDEAVEQDPVSSTRSPLALLPPTLYRASREVLDLFRAIIPITHGHEVANVPRTAAILHNDGVFLAHHCLSLGLEYKEKFPTPQPDDSRGKLLRQTCIFVDMVPLFRVLSDRSMRDMLELQARQVSELVGERITSLGTALRSDKIVAEWSNAERALEAAVYHLRHLQQAWKPVLAQDVLNRSLCYVTDVAFDLFLEQIAIADDISVNACQFVGMLFTKAVRDMKVLLDDDVSGSRVWDRFSAIGQFMDMRLDDISLALSDGVFRSVTSPQLIKLIKACFAESPKRNNLVTVLSSRTY